MATVEQRSEFFNAVLISLSQNEEIANLKVTGFLASEGTKYNKELMLIGRATNGWDAGEIDIQSLKGSTEDEYAQKVFNSVSPKEKCPLAWVVEHWGIKGNKYNSKKSAFWRTAKRVSEGIGIVPPETQDWSSHLVWSNLYKVAMPDSNPSNVLARAQFCGCSSLLNLEIKQYQPKRILISSGIDWAKPFIELICQPDSVVKKNGFVERVAQLKPEYGSARLVVAKHPMGKPESRWVSEVLDAFSAANIVV